jgi:Na+-transporting methylmalonyl-CoA/oxaloacetate decarboxylase gamma subunit
MENLTNISDVNLSLPKIPSFSFGNLINFESIANTLRMGLGILIILITLFLAWKLISILINKKRFWKQEISYRNTKDIKKGSEDLKKETEDIKKDINDIKQSLEEIKSKLFSEKKEKNRQTKKRKK